MRVRVGVRVMKAEVNSFWRSHTHAPLESRAHNLLVESIHVDGNANRLGLVGRGTGRGDGLGLGSSANAGLVLSGLHSDLERSLKHLWC